ncbi:putative transposase [Rhodovulum marinum]|uniref:Putative transposase n=2 Tax=Rhodovulum marinum TaxID=320662 RepID=A0A4R2Q9D7_9RHOB|nr:putative transposase [Rhodovulum marinum]
MSLCIADITGLPGRPKTPMGVRKMLKRLGVPVRQVGKRFEFELADLPEDVQNEWRRRMCEEHHLDPGEHDDAAHVALERAPVSVRERAHDNALKLMFVAKMEAVGATWPEIEKEGKAKFGRFPSRNTVKGWKDKTDGVAPANWAPALAPAWKGGERDEPTPEAWASLVNRMNLSGKNGTGFPLKHAHKQVAKEAAAKGWTWPPYHTIRRRWNDMDPIARLVAEVGEERATALLTLRLPQTAEGMAAMDMVDGDGREFKVRVRWPDGTVGCPWVVAFADRRTRKTVGWAVGKSENSDVTEAAILHMCETHGRPQKVGFDNGSAFNSQRIAGGLTPAYRTKQTRKPDWAVPGVLKIIGAELRNKGVGAKTSNLQENVWSHLRHVDNDPRFHGAQRPGPNDPTPPNGEPVPLEVFEAVLAEAIHDLNTATDNRVKGLLKGESRAEAFERLLKGNRRRVLADFHRRRLAMTWKLKTVREDGRIAFDGGLFGDHTTQREMLRHVGKKVLVGFNPKDFDAPAMVCHWEDETRRGSLFLEELPAVAPTRHGSTEGRRAAATEKQRVRQLVRKFRAAHPEADVAKLREAALDAIGATDAIRRPETGVVELHTDSGFKAAEPGEGAAEVSYLTEERLRNFIEATESQLASR